MDGLGSISNVGAYAAFDRFALGKEGTGVSALGLGGQSSADALQGIRLSVRGESSGGVEVSFSEEALTRSRALAEEKEKDGGAQELTEEEQKEVEDLKKRDTEVRKHEQAHLAAAGQYANGGAQFEFTTGPDGRQYATGGEVSISVSEERTPEATITKAQIVRRAALAPAEPSSQDRSVAAQASKMEMSARRELAEARVEEQQAEKEEGGEVTASALADSPLGGTSGGVFDSMSPAGGGGAKSLDS